MDEIAEWNLLASQFAELYGIEGGKLYVSWPPPGWEIGDQSWRIGGLDNDRLVARFEALAERAGVMLGAAIGPDALVRWLDELKQESTYWQPLQEERRLPNGTVENGVGGIILDVCTASQDHCYRLETAAIQRQLHGPHTPITTTPTPGPSASHFVEHMRRQLEREEEIQHERKLREIREGREPTESPHAPALSDAEATPRSLSAKYLAQFPNEKIKKLDICWAAGQHYCEWKRWLRNAIKKGSTADLAFRGVLTSNQRPGEYRKQPRPDGWK
jgi:hypothetical protein